MLATEEKTNNTVFHTKVTWTEYKQFDVMWDSNTDQRNVLFYVGTVGQIGKNRVHVLDVGDADG